MTHERFSSQSGRIAALDGLRGIAILLVMNFHFYHFPAINGVDVGIGGLASRLWLHNLFMSGWLGVDLFFVLSGFLITRILIETKGKRSYFRNFYMRRVLRIFPIYYLLLALSPLLLGLFPSSLSTGSDPSWGYWLLTYTSNILISFKSWDSVPVVLAHLWSLAVEEQFYLVWPMFIFFFDRKKCIFFCLLIILLCPILRWLLVYQNLNRMAGLLMPTRMDSLATGGLLALLAVELHDKKKFLGKICVVGGASLIGLIVLYILRGGLRSNDSIVTVLGFTLLSLFFGASVIFSYLFGEDSSIVRILSHPLLRYFGKYSYCLYLVHQPVALLVLVTGGQSVAMLTFLKSSPVIALSYYLVLPHLISMLIAMLSWQLIEKPFLKLKVYFA